LKPLAVAKAGNGVFSDGGGLLLQVRGASASWILRYTSPVTRKRREMGLGIAERASISSAGESLVRARHVAFQARDELRQGKDPISEREIRLEAERVAERAKQQAARETRLTLCRAARAYHERVIEPTRSAKHSAQWIKSLENHVPEALWNRSIAQIRAPDLESGLGD